MDSGLLVLTAMRLEGLVALMGFAWVRPLQAQVTAADSAAPFL